MSEKKKPASKKPGHYKDFESIRKSFPDVLRKCNGFIAAACESVGINRRNYYNWREKFPEFAEDCDQIIKEKDGDKGDFVESALFRQIEEGNITAIIFYLKTRCKNRGYTERTEITGADGGPMQTESKVEGTLKSVEDNFNEIMQNIGLTE